MPQPASNDLYIGLMSGTSLDGVDGVLVDSSSAAPRVLANAAVELPPQLRASLLQLNQSGPDELHRAQVAAHQLVQLYAGVVQTLLSTAACTAQAIRAIGAHGQTVRHHPPGAALRGTVVGMKDPDCPPYTLQLNQPALLAERTGITVVADFRSRDVAAGGQGAPLVPAFHRRVFAHTGQAVAVVNIGGIANVTALPPSGEVWGLDTGPGNVLLDLWCSRHTGQSFDAGGAWGSQGRVDPGLLQRLLDEPYFQRSGIKSTGRDLFHADWLADRLQGFGHLAPVDIQATLVALTAQTIAHCLRQLDWGAQGLQDVLVCGGGAHNAGLMAALSAELPAAQVRSTDRAGWPVSLVEAAAFAWLAQQALTGLPGNVPAVTGAAGPRVLGAIYPA